MRSGTLPWSFRMLVGVAVGLIGMAVMAIGLTVSALRTDATRNALQNAGNIATILADQTAHAVKALDAKLSELQVDIAVAGVETTADLHRLMGDEATHEHMKRHLAQVAHADVIIFIDADGEFVNSTRRWPPIPLDFADRDYFRYLQEHDDPRLYVGLPVAARLVGTRTLYFAKRLTTRSGAFLGVVTIGVPLSYFQHIFDAISSLRGQSFLFLRSDGTVLHRYPDPNNSTRARMPPNAPWYALVAKGGGAYRSPGYFDGDARLVGVRPLRDYPLVVNAGINETTALASWRRHATLIGIGTLLAVLCSAFLIKALIGQFRALARSETSLAERKASLANKSRELERANRQLAAAVNNMSQGLCMFDRDGRLVICNERYVSMYRLPRGLVTPGRPISELLAYRVNDGTFSRDPDDYITDLRARLTQGQCVAFTNEMSDGRIIAVSSLPTGDGGWVATHDDITERQKVEARIAHMARHDALTDLANRVLFLERMDAALARQRGDGEGFAIFVFDLDLFKSVNDSLGHPVGDELLRRAARRLDACMRPGWTAARVGGDEFAVIQTGEADPRTAAGALAEMLLERICAPYEIDGHRIVIGISIGIAVAPANGSDAGELLKNADLALYRAKDEGRKGLRFYEPGMDAAARLHRALEVDLRNALARNEFELHYQTLLDIGTHRICAAEALIRWRHPEHGLIPPDRFVPVAEEIGFIIPLGEWVLATACAEAATWPAHIKLAVNLSPVQFRSAHLVGAVRAALAGSGLAPERLELEITESVLLQKDAGNLAMLHDLASLGVSIVLDDFGTGYSSLSYLRTFPFHKIKIDQSFVGELGQRTDCTAIVCAITSLARSLNVLTTAEGVETRAQLELLRAAGCSQAQGYLVSRPLPAGEIDLFAEHGHLRVA